MRIEKCFYKDVPAYILDTGVCRATVLAEDGGKIASLVSQRSGREYLVTRGGDRYARMGLCDSFELCECSGFDDMFPTIDPECVKISEDVEYSYPDHGEVCRVAHEARLEDTRLTLSYTSERFGYSFEKTFTEGESGDIKSSYKIKNISEHPLPALFAAHCLLLAEEGGRLILPFDIGEPTDLVFDNSGRFPYPSSLLLSEHFLDTHVGQDAPHCKKIYFPRKCPSGRVEYKYPSGERFVMTFDNEALSCLGIWYNYRGIRGDLCLGIEPATLGYDTVSAAEKHGQVRPILRDEPLEFFISIGVN